MCGITAIISLDNSQEISSYEYRLRLEKEITQSLDKINHRGPDARGSWVSDGNRVVLGLARLSINDLTESGIQPFHSNGRNIHVVVNGEIYLSDAEIKDEKLEDFHQFNGRSDSEVVIPLYQKYGINFLSKLRGEFALVLYDSERQLLVAARDRYGIKPLFWTVVDNRLLVSSEAKGFLPLGWKAEWDVRSLIEEGWLHDERTIFKGVRKLRPGHYMTCLSFDYLEQRQYWDLDYPDKHVPQPRSSDEMVQGVENRLREAVKLRLHADSEVGMGFYLSGGIDSAAICGIASNLIEDQCIQNGVNVGKEKRRFKCFTIGFDSATEFDETEIARRTADMLGLTLITQRMDDDLFAENFSDATYHSEHHNPDLNSVGKFCLSKLAQEHGCKVILSGEGSDEHFGGYAHFFPDFFREEDKSWCTYNLDKKARSQVTVRYENHLTTNPGYKGIGELKVDANGILIPEKALVRYSPASLCRRMLNDTSIALNLFRTTIVTFSPWTTGLGKLHPEETRARNPSVQALNLIAKKWHPFHTAQYVWTKSILPNLILTCMGDRMEMAHSIEGRPPFLDHELTQYVNDLPPNVKIRYDATTGEATEKWILREAVRPYVLDELYKRKKHAFTAPPAVGPKMHRLLTGLVNAETVDNLGFLEWSLVKNHLSNAFGCTPDIKSLRYIFTVAQWVILSQRFGIAKAEPTPPKESVVSCNRSKSFSDGTIVTCQIVEV